MIYWDIYFNNMYILSSIGTPDYRLSSIKTLNKIADLKLNLTGLPQPEINVYLTRLPQPEINVYVPRRAVPRRAKIIHLNLHKMLHVTSEEAFLEHFSKDTLEDLKKKHKVSLLKLIYDEINPPVLYRGNRWLDSVITYD